MYKIEITNVKGVFIAELLFKFPFDKDFTTKSIERHADFGILHSKIKKWFITQRKQELKYN